MKRFGNVIASKCDASFDDRPSVRSMNGDAVISVAHDRVVAYLVRDGVVHGPQITVIYDLVWLSQQSSETIVGDPRWRMVSLLASTYFRDAALNEISSAIHWAAQS